MRWGVLREQFKGVGWKRLTDHEVNPVVSNGHEFQGVGALRALLGDTERRDAKAKYLLLDDDPDETLVVESTISWYDSRARQAHRSPEWRLYYPKAAGAIQSRMRAGDLMVVCVSESDDISVLLARSGSSSEAKLRLLFGVDEPEGERVVVRRFEGADSLDFASALVLEELGLGQGSLQEGADRDEVDEVADRLIRVFPGALPTGVIVSSIVAGGVRHVDPLDAPDHALVRWLEVEEAAYRIWEDAKIARRIAQGFIDPSGTPDVKAFRDLAMTLRQSRVSRAGGALQNHVARILDAHDIRYQPQAQTEKGETPDFLFPGGAAYADPSYPDSDLRLLAAKFTVKERWRQVLNEGARIRQKHLLTVDRTITTSTLHAMRSAQLYICIPTLYRAAYPSAVHGLILSLRELLGGPLARHRRSNPPE